MYLSTVLSCAEQKGWHNSVHGWLCRWMSESYYRQALSRVSARHNFMSHSGKLAQQWYSSQQCAPHGTSLSSDVLIARVRTLALCWTRRHPTIAYKYHGSLLWIVQLGTNIRETCRWIVNLFLADAEVQLTNITWGVKSKRFGYSYMQNSRKGQVTHKN